MGHTFGVRVDGAAPRGLWPPVGGGLCRRVVKGKVQRVQKVVVSPLRGDEYICRLSANPFRLAALATHPLDRGGQGLYALTFPPDTVILSRRRRILVSAANGSSACKYQSAGNTSGVCRK